MITGNYIFEGLNFMNDQHPRNMGNLATYLGKTTSHNYGILVTKFIKMVQLISIIKLTVEISIVSSAVFYQYYADCNQILNYFFCHLLATL